MRTVLSMALLATCAVACGADQFADDAEPRRGGGWDLNSGNWNGNMGTWGTVSGIGGNPPWAADGTGTGTLTNYSLVGVRWTAPQATAACGALPPGVDRVRFLSSTRTGNNVVGPDVEVERAGVKTRLAMGEEVLFHGEALDGTLASIRVTLRVRRVDTLSHEAAPNSDWPVFSLELCEHARPDRGFGHLGYVSWAPMVQLPENESGGFQFPAGIVQPVTTLPRPEYRENQDVPRVVANQTGALMFKFAFYASVPVALADEPDLAFTTSRGASISNNQVLVRGAIALGNGGWVTMPGDAGHHQFLTFFTRTGTAASMFSIARGDGSGPAEVKLPATWGRGAISALQLTPAELVPAASFTLDTVHAYVAGAMGPADVWARGPSEVGHGPSTQRHGYYLGNSGNNNRMVFFSQLQVSTARARWAGVINGRITSQTQLAQLMMLASPGPTLLLAAESPPPPGKPGFESPELEPMPQDSPVFHEPIPIDAHEWELDARVDAPTDAATDARVIDASVDAAIDAMPTDAMVPPDAGLDAAAMDAAVPMDGGVDALMPVDAISNPMCKAPGGMCDAPLP